MEVITMREDIEIFETEMDEPEDWVDIAWKRNDDGTITEKGDDGCVVG
jgi:hypothetical protein